MKKLVVLLLALAFIVGFATDAFATQRGDKGAEVTEIQTILKGYGYSVVVDGTYGPQTEKAVRSWQKSNGLTVDGIVGPATLGSLRGAVRQGNAKQVTGLRGLPFAPDGLGDCDEMQFYRKQAGLPDRFDALGYRESRCRNEDGVRTYCCYGYWQNYISSHLSRNSLYRSRIINECLVTGADDINSDDPVEKQKQACVTSIVYAISGYSPWAT